MYIEKGLYKKVNDMMQNYHEVKQNGDYGNKNLDI